MAALMEVVVLVSGACLVGLMLLVVSWLTDLEGRVRRLEQPRAWLGEKEVPVARRRSSGAE